MLPNIRGLSLLNKIRTHIFNEMDTFIINKRRIVNNENSSIIKNLTKSFK